MRKLFLHIGMEKTGSTSIQKFLTKNSATLLKSHGILWPQHPDVFFNYGHFPITASLLGTSACDFVPPEKHLSPAEVFSAFSHVCRNNQFNSVVLSAEHFSSRLDGAAILELSKRLMDFDVSVIVYVRRQDQMALSYFSTGVRYGRREWLSTTEIVPENSIFDIRGLLDSWARHFGGASIKVRVFDRNMLVGGDVIPDFLSVIGVDDATGLRNLKQQENVALTTKQIKFLTALNKRLPTFREAVELQNEELFRIAQRTRERAIGILNKMDSFLNSPSIRTILSLQDRQDILESFRADNDYVAKTYTDRSSLFAEFPNDVEGSALESKTGEPEITEDELLEFILRSLERSHGARTN